MKFTIFLLVLVDILAINSNVLGKHFKYQPKRSKFFSSTTWVNETPVSNTTVKPPSTTAQPSNTTTTSTAQSTTTTTTSTTQPTTTTTTTTTTTASPGTVFEIKPDCSACGISSVNNTRIVGGAESKQGAYPWIASIRSKSGSHFCGGALISDRWVVSAAHCTSDETAANIVVVLGEHNRELTNNERMTLDVNQIINHKSFDTVTKVNDISLIQLAGSVTCSIAVNPVCLPKDTWQVETWESSKAVTVAGWGTLGSGESAPSELRYVGLHMFKHADCNSIYGGITSEMVCAYDKGKDSCQGDSGGPLTYVDAGDKRTYEVGVVSFGDGCAKDGVPGVYANVVKYLTWIQSKIA